MNELTPSKIVEKFTPTQNEVIPQYVRKISRIEYIHDIRIMSPKSIPPRNPKYKYTIFLDLDQTLINVSNNGDLVIGPYTLDFLNEIKDTGVIELILWTAGLRPHLKTSMDILELSRPIFDYGIFRENTWYSPSLPIRKNIDDVRGRRGTSIFIDDLDEIGYHNRFDSINITPFQGDSDDNTLLYLSHAIIRAVNIINQYGLPTHEFPRLVLEHPFIGCPCENGAKFDFLDFEGIQNRVELFNKKY